MAYSVDFTDSNKGAITVEDNSPNTETSLTMIGRNYTDYGEIFNENFLHLLENFANNTSPINPVEGQLWYDTTDGVDQLKVYDGTQWVSAGGLKKASSQPAASNSVIGDLWIDTSNQQVYLYSGSGWILVGPEYAAGASTGAKFEWIPSTDPSSDIDTTKGNPCIITYSNDIAIAIISSRSFQPKIAINGFYTISAGVNVSSNYKFYGTSEKSENLIVSGTTYAGSEFARLNAANIFSRPIRITSGSGITIGESQTLTITTSGSNIDIINKSTDGSTNFKVAANTTAIKITADGNIGLFNSSPTEVLDVTGNIKASGTLTIGAATFSGNTSVTGNISTTGNTTIAGTLTTGNVYRQSSTNTIGISSEPFNTIYVGAVNASTVTANTVIASLTGTATKASQLTQTTTFSLTGDITASAVNYNGTANVALNTTLGTSYFTGKTDITTVYGGGRILPTDQILINRPTADSELGDLNTGLYKITQEDLVATIPVFQPGMMMPYAGSTAPAKWAFCYGQVVSTSTYSALFTAIGYAYDTSLTSTSFRLPDMRGRLPLGADNIGGTSANRVTAPTADVIGQSFGAESVTISVSNLPDHDHSLMGDAGTQFYSVTNVTGGSDSNSTGISIIGGDSGTGLSVSGGINGWTSQENLNIMPPYLTVNYIIYTGV
tara:strand:+ start:190 stop:2181 length:1992 start_codon:yes stop_codon:yes gene_type:complete